MTNRRTASGRTIGIQGAFLTCRSSFAWPISIQTSRISPGSAEGIAKTAGKN
jgi:hypothetical protein